jgi:hypothetical protein
METGAPPHVVGGEETFTREPYSFHSRNPWEEVDPSVICAIVRMLRNGVCPLNGSTRLIELFLAVHKMVHESHPRSNSANDQIRRAFDSGFVGPGIRGLFGLTIYNAAAASADQRELSPECLDLIIVQIADQLAVRNLYSEFAEFQAAVMVPITLRPPLRLRFDRHAERAANYLMSRALWKTFANYRAVSSKWRPNVAAMFARLAGPSTETTPWGDPQPDGVDMAAATPWWQLHAQPPSTATPLRWQPYSRRSPRRGPLPYDEQ